MQIRETGGVNVIHPDQTLDEAAAEMKRLDLAAVTGNERLAGETLKLVSDPTPPKTDEAATQAPPEATHAQSVDSEGQTPLTADLPSFTADPGAPGSGEDPTSAEPQQPQDLLSEIKHVAQRVGGWKQLSEIAEALEVDAESISEE